MSGYGLYDGFADLYDEFWAQAYLADARAGLEQFFLPRIPEGGRVLDVCCGPGRLVRALADLGFDVEGVDGSAQMIELARRNSPDSRFHVADVRSFRLDPPADAVICTFDSVNHFESIDELSEMFACVADSLVAGGLFCFDFNTDEGFRANDDEDLTLVEDGRAAVIRSRYFPERKRGVSEGAVFRRDGDCWRRSDVRIPEYCHPSSELLGALESAGFEIAAVLDADEDWKMPLGEGRRFVLAFARTGAG